VETLLEFRSRPRRLHGTAVIAEEPADSSLAVAVAKLPEAENIATSELTKQTTGQLARDTCRVAQI